MTDPLKEWPKDHGKKSRTDVEPTTGVYVHRMHRDHITRFHGENIHPKERGMTLQDSQNGQRDRHTDERMDRRTDRPTKQQTDGQTDSYTEGQTDTQTDRRTDGQMERQKDRYTDRRTDRETD